MVYFQGSQAAQKLKLCLTETQVAIVLIESYDLTQIR